VAQLAEKKAREIQNINSQLARQLGDDEKQVQLRNNELRKLKGEQERADRIIRELARKS